MLPVIMIFMTSCASTRSYFADRGRDTLDVMTVTVGIGAGIHARLGPFPFGAWSATDVAGLRYGSFFARIPDTDEREEVNSKLMSFLLPIMLIFSPGGEMNWDSLPDIWHYGNYYPMNEIQLLRNKSTENLEVPNYTQLEASVGIGPSLRLGLNPGEFLDLVLGLTTIDIFDDDIGLRSGQPDQPRDPNDQAD